MIFSITIPAYKKKFLQDAIESCLVQTYSNFELIIVDDASPEDLILIVEQFHDERIRYYRNEKNFGAIDVVDNWNKCLEYATGDYIICMGDDDKLLPNCLEKYIRLMEKYPDLGVYHAWAELIDENSKYIDIQAPRPEWESGYSLLWNRWNGRNKQYIGDFCFNVKRLRENGGFYKLPLAWSSDDITAVIAAKNGGIANTQCITFQYRVNSQTITNQGRYDVKVMAVNMERQWYQNFLQDSPKNEIERKFYLSICKMLDKYFNKKIARTIGMDVQQNVFRIIHWFRVRKEFKLSGKMLLYSLFIAIKKGKLK